MKIDEKSYIYPCIRFGNRFPKPINKNSFLLNWFHLTIMPPPCQGETGRFFQITGAFSIPDPEEAQRIFSGGVVVRTRPKASGSGLSHSCFRMMSETSCREMKA